MSSRRPLQVLTALTLVACLTSPALAASPQRPQPRPTQQNPVTGPARQAAPAAQEQSRRATREQELREQRQRELQQGIEEQVRHQVEQTVQPGGRQGQRERAAKEARTAVLKKAWDEGVAESRRLVAQAREILQEQAGDHPVAALKKLRAIQSRLESNYLKLSTIAVEMPGFRDDLQPARRTLLDLMGRIRLLAEQSTQQATSLEASAEAALAAGQVDDALAKLTEGAAKHPYPQGLVKKIVSLSQKAGKQIGKIWVNGQAVKAQPVLREGRNLVPLRALAEALGVQPEWNAETRTVTFTKGDTTVQLTIDSQDVLVNSKKIAIDVPATIVEGRTHVPVRAVAELLEAEVNYDAETGAVTVDEPLPETSAAEVEEGGSTDGSTDAGADGETDAGADGDQS